MAGNSTRKNIPTSKYPHLRRQYREYRRKQARQGKSAKGWDEWARQKPKVKTIEEKRKKRNNNK